MPLCVMVVPEAYRPHAENDATCSTSAQSACFVVPVADSEPIVSRNSSLLSVEADKPTWLCRQEFMTFSVMRPAAPHAIFDLPELAVENGKLMVIW